MDVRVVVSCYDGKDLPHDRGSSDSAEDAGVARVRPIVSHYEIVVRGYRTASDRFRSQLPVLRVVPAWLVQQPSIYVDPVSSGPNRFTRDADHSLHHVCAIVPARAAREQLWMTEDNDVTSIDGAFEAGGFDDKYPIADLERRDHRSRRDGKGLDDSQAKHDCCDRSHR